jgi:hypothetical protein
MTARHEQQDDSSTAKGMKPATLLTLLVISVLLVGVGIIFWRQIQATPAREVAVMVPPYGIITVRVTTNQFPPTTTGPVELTLLMQAAGGSTVTLDRVTYSASAPGGEPIEGIATQIARNTYQGTLRFDSVDDWQVAITIEKDGRANEGTVTVPVRPAM